MINHLVQDRVSVPSLFERLDFVIQHCVIKVVVWIQFTERVLRQEHIRCRAVEGVPVFLLASRTTLSY